ncbi:MAG TPA: substrate-binding domain-containing protein, partial [Puia sp.]|nr:substrate-binding domain-containing protein [Puia sp.]
MVVFDDNNFLRAHSPSITAVAQPIDELCAALVRMLSSQINEKPKKAGRRGHETAILPVSLVIRQSSMALRGGGKKAAPGKNARGAKAVAVTAAAPRTKRGAKAAAIK